MTKIIFGERGNRTMRGPWVAFHCSIPFYLSRYAFALYMKDGKKSFDKSILFING